LGGHRAPCGREERRRETRGSGGSGGVDEQWRTRKRGGAGAWETG
jgi:hypothetical protein